MGNVNMEAYQVHFEGKSVAEKLKELDETVKENEQEIDSLSDIVSIKADRIDIAPIFSEESAYSAGDLVYNSNSLWKFSVDHAAGDWDPSEVSAVNIDMELSELKNTIIDQTAGETFIIDTTLMPLFYDGAAYSGYVSFPFAAKNTNYTVALNEVIQNNIGNVTAIATVTVKKKIGFEFKITGTYDYSKCGARINCTITFA